MPSTAFDFEHSEKSLEYHGFKDTIVTGFKIYLPDIFPEEEITKEVEEINKAQQERDLFTQSMIVEILKSGKNNTGDGTDFYADVLITDVDTKESAKFSCRNIFDFGYVINPMYSIAKGITGGIVNNDMWQSFKDTEGWHDIRPLTEFEKKAIDYLYKRPPIGTSIRM